MGNEVDVDECTAIRALRAKGNTIEEIAEQHNRTYTTTRRHADGLCWHRRDKIDDPEPEEMARLLAELADELERIPTQDEWDGWSDAICSASVIETRFDSWENAHAAAGLPEIAIDSPQLVREVAYERPELTATTEEEYQAKQAEAND